MVHLDQDEEEDLLITICDNGIGIPENEQDKIFREFFRSSNITKDKHEGAGIGLSIVKEIIEKHKIIAKEWHTNNKNKIKSIEDIENESEKLAL